MAGAARQISGSKPFLAFMTENQGFLGWPEQAEALHKARANREPKQREVSPGSKYAFEKQVRAWYRAVALTLDRPRRGCGDLGAGAASGLLPVLHLHRESR